VNLDNIENIFNDEVQNLNNEPILKGKTATDMVNFSLSSLWSRARVVAPVMTAILETCKITAFIVGILMNAFNPTLTAIQSLISNVFYHAGAEKQLISDRNAIGVCKSYSSTLDSISRIRDKGDENVAAFIKEGELPFFVINNIDWITKKREPKGNTRMWHGMPPSREL